MKQPSGIKRVIVFIATRLTLLLILCMSLVFPAIAALAQEPTPSQFIAPNLSLQAFADSQPVVSTAGPLQFQAGNHLAGFLPNKVYLAALDHALSVEFVGTAGVTPQVADSDLWGLEDPKGLSSRRPLTRVTYPDLWPGITVVYDAADEGIAKTTYQLAPGADAAQIQLRYNLPVELQPGGSLKFTVDSGRGALTESAPVAWQEIDGQRTPVDVAFVALPDNTVSFHLGAHDPRTPLVIDPVYAWHTFYGGMGNDFANALAVDGSGDVVVAGYSTATWQGDGNANPLHAYSSSVDTVVMKMTQPPGWTATGEASSSFGVSASSAGDVNGDGYADVIIGASDYNSNQGQAYVYLGSAGGLNATPAFTATGGVVGDDWLGISVASAGDVNGDGYADVIIGAYGYNSYQGRAYVYLGGTGGLSANPAFTATGEAVADYFGVSVASAGDVNGDGYADVVVGAYQYNNQQGRAYVYMGAVSGLSATPAMTITGEATSSLLGHGVGSAGDVNGDGYADVLIGAHGYDVGSNTNEGRVYVYLGGSGGLNATPALTLTGAAGDQMGGSVAGAGDVNGDGYADVVIGAGGYDSLRGRAYVYLGGAGGLSATPAITFTGEATNNEFGGSVRSAGDANGDGYADIVIAAYKYNSRQGRVYFYQGGASGLSATPTLTLTGEATGTQFGCSAASAGDVNGDGYTEVIVGAPAYDSSHGRAYLYLGGAGALVPSAAFTYTGETTNNILGGWASSVGDVNGDGYGDVAIAAQYYNNKQGRAYIYMGGTAGPSASPAVTFTGETAGDELGWPTASAGDVNGDGYGDVIIGTYAYLAETGRAYLYLGGAAGLSATPALTLTGEMPDTRFGGSAASAGDVNGDGYGDVIIGAARYNSGLGRAYLYMGGPGGLSSTPALTVSGQAFFGYLGESVASAGDVNGDGYADVLIGSDRADGWQGRAYLYMGGPSGLSTSPTLTLTGEITHSYFGFPVASAGDVNGDGYSDVIIGAYYSFDLGRAYLYLGGAGGLNATPAMSFTGEMAISSFGYAAASAGDVNGDGYADVIIGAYRNNSDQGRAYVYLGGPSGLSASPTFTVSGETTSNNFGTSVASAGDVNGDGYADVVIGADNYNSGQGRAYIYLGNEGDGLNLTPRQMRTDGSAQVAPEGMSDSSSAVQLRLTGHTPMGREKVKLQYQVAPLGTPFTATTGVISGTSAAWTDVLTTGKVITQNVTGLMSGTSYHWRVRLLYRPGNAFGQVASRWLTVPWNGWNEADFRTAVMPPTNSPPVANADTKSTDEDTALTFPASDLTANDTDVDGDSLLVTAVTAGANTHGVVTLAAGSISYTPELDYNGAASFSYTISDGNGGSDTAIVTITVNPVNDAPVTNADTKSTDEDTALTFPASDLTANDTDVDGDSLLVTAVTAGANTHGVVTLAAGSISYTPELDYNGAASFSYTISDGNGGSDTAIVTITVNPVNDAPVLALIGNKSVNEGQPLQFTLSATDVDGNPLTFAANNIPIEAAFDTSTATFSYTPDYDVSTQAANSFFDVVFEVNDGSGGIDNETVRITVMDVVGGTPDGLNVVVQPVDQAGATPVTLTFFNVVTSGVTSLITSDTCGRPCQPPPPTFRLGNPAKFYDLTTTAVYVGAIEICIDYGDVAYKGQETNLQINHFENGNWVKQTTTFQDTTNDILCAVVSSLSPFAIFEPNLPPSISTGGPYRVDESDSVLVTASGTDPEGDTITFAWDLDNDGGFETAGQSATFSAATLDGPDCYTVTIQVADSLGLAATDQTVVEVLNVNPTAVLSNDGPVSEGSPATISFSDPNDPSFADTAAGFRYAFACDGGTLDGVTFTTSSAAATHTCTFDNGPSTNTVRARILDKDGGYSEYTTVVAVTNVAPTVNAGPDRTVDEGESVLMIGSFNDPGALDTHTIVWDFGDGTTVSGTLAPTHTYADDGVYMVTLTVTDDDGGVGRDMRLVTVTNVAPTASFTASSPVNEGYLINLTLTGPSDPSGTDTIAGFTYAFDCGSGYSMPSRANTTSCNAIDDPAQTVKGKIMDKDGGYTEYTAVVAVSNVAPLVGDIVAPLNPRQVNTLVAASAIFTDTGMLDTHTALWDWGDANISAGMIDETNGSGSATGSHAYIRAGVYTIQLTVTDKDGGSTQAFFRYVVVYDPSAGFVTGGGWINSPAGACKLTTVCEGATGKANFGFEAKYKTGTNVPTGNTEFNFKAGNLNFKSAEYQWLVVAGAKAQYKGSGTINDSGDYGFMLTAIDGQINGGGGVDKFRIKIWDKATGVVVYDNQMGAAEDADPTTAIGGGSIVIHKD